MSRLINGERKRGVKFDEAYEDILMTCLMKGECFVKASFDISKSDLVLEILNPMKGCECGQLDCRIDEEFR